MWALQNINNLFISKSVGRVKRNVGCMLQLFKRLILQRINAQNV